MMYASKSATSFWALSLARVLLVEVCSVASTSATTIGACASARVGHVLEPTHHGLNRQWWSECLVRENQWRLVTQSSP